MTDKTIQLYFPAGVSDLVGIGSDSFIGRMENQMVLKYPKDAEQGLDRIRVEAHIYTALGSHPRILAYHGIDERGLILTFASNGSVREYLQKSITTGNTVSPDTRLKWARQAAEAIAYIHTKNVIHCDISTRNLLLDEKMDVKLSDFQGIYTDPRGEVFDGSAIENVKSYLPRPANQSNPHSDLFALGSALYEIMSGDAPFPELDELEDEDEIETRFRNGCFPTLDDVLAGQIIYKCWTVAYQDAYSCTKELRVLEKNVLES